MANFGLCKGYVAKRTAKGNYAEGMKLGEAINTSVDPQYKEAKLYGDNRLVRSKKKLDSANVTLGVTEVPLKAANTLFGHTVDEETKKVTSKDSDEGTDCGYGFISAETDGGKDIFVAVILHNVKFTESGTTYTTQGENLTFSTPSLSAVAKPDEDGEWRTTTAFDTEAAAESAIKTFLKITG